MSQLGPDLGAGRLLKQPGESPLQLWIRVWQAQLVAGSR
jgi:hypothetical protein